MSSYLYATGFDSLTSLKDMHFDAPTSKWGYADDVTLDDFARKVGRLSQSGQPFFATMLTLSSHEPFDVPYDKFEDRMLNSMAFTDECLHNWIERMKRTPAWDNLLVIIVADHSYSYPYNISNAVPERYRIPMLWTGGAVRGPQVIDTYASQTDLAATLLEQLGLPHDDFRFSRDIMCPEVPHFGYFTFNNGFGVVDSIGATVFDCTTQRVISPTAPPGSSRPARPYADHLQEHTRDALTANGQIKERRPHTFPVCGRLFRDTGDHSAKCRPSSFCQRPRVKSGTATGMLPFSIEAAVSSPMHDHSAAS